MPTRNGETYWWVVTRDVCSLKCFKTRREARERAALYRSKFVVRKLTKCEGGRPVILVDGWIHVGEMRGPGWSGAEVIQVKGLPADWGP